MSTCIFLKYSGRIDVQLFRDWSNEGMGLLPLPLPIHYFNIGKGISVEGIFNKK